MSSRLLVKGSSTVVRAVVAGAPVLAGRHVAQAILDTSTLRSLSKCGEAMIGGLVWTAWTQGRVASGSLHYKCPRRKKRHRWQLLNVFPLSSETSIWHRNERYILPPDLDHASRD